MPTRATVWSLSPHPARAQVFANGEGGVCVARPDGTLGDLHLDDKGQDRVAGGRGCRRRPDRAPGRFGGSVLSGGRVSWRLLPLSRTGMFCLPVHKVTEEKWRAGRAW